MVVGLLVGWLACCDVAWCWWNHALVFWADGVMTDQPALFVSYCAHEPYVGFLRVKPPRVTGGGSGSGYGLPW